MTSSFFSHERSPRTISSSSTEYLSIAYTFSEISDRSLLPTDLCDRKYSLTYRSKATRLLLWCISFSKPFKIVRMWFLMNLYIKINSQKGHISIRLSLGGRGNWFCGLFYLVLTYYYFVEISWEPFSIESISSRQRINVSTSLSTTCLAALSLCSSKLVLIWYDILLSLKLTLNFWCFPPWSECVKYNFLSSAGLSSQFILTNSQLSFTRPRYEDIFSARMNPDLFTMMKLNYSYVTI